MLLWHWALPSSEGPAKYDEHRMIHTVGSDLTAAAGFASAILSGVQQQVWFERRLITVEALLVA